MTQGRLKTRWFQVGQFLVKHLRQTAMGGEQTITHQYCLNALVNNVLIGCTPVGPCDGADEHTTERYYQGQKVVSLTYRYDRIGKAVYYIWSQILTQNYLNDCQNECPPQLGNLRQD